MTASTAFIGKGTSISWNTATVAEIIGTPTGPSMTADSVERTHMDSTGITREFMAGLVDGGEVTFDIAFLVSNATQTAIRDDMVAGTTREVIITYSDSGTGTATFNAFCTAYGPSMPIDDRVTASITLKVASAPVFS